MAKRIKITTYGIHPIFIILIVLGAAIIGINYFYIKENYILTLGITFFTLGGTIPISLYFQAKQSSEIFQIINACHNYGIENIFEGRKHRKPHLRMWESIDTAFKNTKNLYLFGIAFPQLLNPGISGDSAAKKGLKDSRINLNIILLNPDSAAANRRAEIEDPDNICEEGDTICNIRRTIDNHTKIIMRARLENRYGEQWKKSIADLRDAIEKKDCEEEFYNRLLDDIQMRVKITDFEPINFLVVTDKNLFSEQYSFGRPSDMENSATCVGGYLPAIQYKKSSDGYKFLKSHFEYVWNHIECTQDISISHMKSIVKNMKI